LERGGGLIVWPGGWGIHIVAEELSFAVVNWRH
jgi:hypothetical protein